jgi:hypothetical protein
MNFKRRDSSDNNAPRQVEKEANIYRKTKIAEPLTSPIIQRLLKRRRSNCSEKATRRAYSP